MIPLGKIWAASAALVAAVKEDYGSVQRYRQKYHDENITSWRLPLDVVKKIGLQTLVATRLMQWSRDAELPLVPQVLSRLIRHAYSAEIHWHAQVAPGVSIVHGVGLVISHRAVVDRGCILFHGVTLGEGIDAETREVGAPHLCEDVHVGPGATLLGPITIGAGSKIMAGAVVTISVPPGSVVRSAGVEVLPRGAPPTTSAPESNSDFDADSITRAKGNGMSMSASGNRS